MRMAGNLASRSLPAGTDSPPSRYCGRLGRSHSRAGSRRPRVARSPGSLSGGFSGGNIPIDWLQCLYAVIAELLPVRASLNAFPMRAARRAPPPRCASPDNGRACSGRRGAGARNRTRRSDRARRVLRRGPTSVPQPTRSRSSTCIGSESLRTTCLITSRAVKGRSAADRRKRAPLGRLARPGRPRRETRTAIPSEFPSHSTRPHSHPAEY